MCDGYKALGCEGRVVGSGFTQSRYGYSQYEPGEVTHFVGLPSLETLMTKYKYKNKFNKTNKYKH